jgi:hypothetical protein
MDNVVRLDADDLLAREFSKLVFKAKAEGHKSSEGDGRTAADIERELEEARKKEPADAAQ